MSQKKTRGSLVSFTLGLAAGAGLVAYLNKRARNAPFSLPDQQRIGRALQRALTRARQYNSISLGSSHRYVIFSDHHRGAGDEADDFRDCKETYIKALDEYNQRGFSLILLGDVEELWENDIPEVMATYPDVIESEQRFYPERYLRLVGNHDNPWEIEDNVIRYLAPYFPGIRIYYSLIFRFQDGPDTSGEIFLAHGHQGTIDADVFDFLPPLVLPLYRQFQNLTGTGHTSPSRDDCLRSNHDTMMYRWASQQGKLLFIAGHTHRPIWSSRTHLEKLLWQYTALLELKPSLHPDDYAQQLNALKAEIEEREVKYPPCNDTIKTESCYFNTGCCRFEDGDITGIEIEDGEIRLVKWGKKEGAVQRTEFEKAPLAELFALL